MKKEEWPLAWQWLFQTNPQVIEWIAKQLKMSLPETVALMKRMIEWHCTGARDAQVDEQVQLDKALKEAKIPMEGWPW